MFFFLFGTLVAAKALFIKLSIRKNNAHIHIWQIGGSTISLNIPCLFFALSYWLGRDMSPNINLIKTLKCLYSLLIWTLFSF